MKFGDAGLKLTIGLDQSQLKMITEFIFERIKEARKEVEEEITEVDERLCKEIDLIKGKLP